PSSLEDRSCSRRRRIRSSRPVNSALRGGMSPPQIAESEVFLPAPIPVDPLPPGKLSDIETDLWDIMLLSSLAEFEGVSVGCGAWGTRSEAVVPCWPDDPGTRGPVGAISRRVSDQSSGCPAPWWASICSLMRYTRPWWR